MVDACTSLVIRKRQRNPDKARRTGRISNPYSEWPLQPRPIGDGRALLFTVLYKIAGLRTGATGLSTYRNTAKHAMKSE
jgi:hypothetical protein